VLEAGRNVFNGTAEEALSFYHRSVLQIDGVRPTDRLHVLYEGSSEETERDAEIIRVETLDSDGNPKEVVSTFDALVLRITYRARKRVERASAVLQIASAEGAKILFLSTQPEYVLPLTLEEGEHSVDCVIDELPLSAGEYVIGAGLAIPYVEWITWTPELARLQISPRDVYGSGFAPTSSRSLVAVKHSWRLV
jgi:hypothetical protein